MFILVSTISKSSISVTIVAVQTCNVLERVCRTGKNRQNLTYHDTYHDNYSNPLILGSSTPIQQSLCRVFSYNALASLLSCLLSH